MKKVDIKAHNLFFSYDAGFSLKNISFEVFKGECFQIMGDSNAGKSTLLKLLIGILSPFYGGVLLFEKDINKLQYSELKEIKKKIGVVFQDSIPINNISIFENVALPLRYHTKLRELEIRKKVKNALEELEIYHLSEMRPVKLPNKDKIKLDIARALILEPEILFIDNPFSRIDIQDASKILHLLKTIQGKNVTIFIISNDKIILQNLSDRAGVLKEGEMLKIAQSSEILQDENIYIKSLLLREIILQQEENICDIK